MKKMITRRQFMAAAGVVAAASALPLLLPAALSRWV